MQEIFRYGSKGTKLGLLDVITARGDSEFTFKGKDILYTVKIKYDKKYLFEVLGEKINISNVCKTKADLEYILGDVLEKLGFSGKDKKSAFTHHQKVTLDLGLDNLVNKEITENEDSDFEGLEQKRKDEEEKFDSIKFTIPTSVIGSLFSLNPTNIYDEKTVYQDKGVVIPGLGYIEGEKYTKKKQVFIVKGEKGEDVGLKVMTR